MDNQRKYSVERGKRWSMAKDGEPRAIEAACGMLRDALDTDCSSMRYDTEWFHKFTPEEDEHAWVRGAPDYLITIGTDRYLYAEIKIKAVKFKKTEYGGVTRSGTPISRYGCKSFYLDRVPVYKHMCDFSKEAGIDPASFMLLFVSEDMGNINAISLLEIKDLIRNGYKGTPICQIQEGYGTDTEEGTAPSYLIPEDATHPIHTDSAEYFWHHVSDQLIIPAKQYYAANQWFYHCDRDCGYISGKADEELLIFDSEKLAAASGRRRCNACFHKQEHNNLK